MRIQALLRAMRVAIGVTFTVVSDYDRNDCIWRVPVSEIRRLFNVTAQDYPHSVHLVYNHEKGDYDVSTN